MTRALLAAVLGAALLACGPNGRHASSAGDALAGLPPHTDPPLALDDDDDLARSRAIFDGLKLDDPNRSAQRRQLVAAYQQRIDGFLAADSRNDAFVEFQNALEMWDPAELQDPSKAAPDFDLVGPTAQTIYDRFAPTGGDIQAVTALTALMAANPAKAPDYQKQFADIAAYSDDLEVSEKGEGARGLRSIEMLEDSTKHFPLPWACQQLVTLYLARQDALNSAISLGKGNADSLAVQGAGILMPVWNIIRAYARMGRLHEATEIVDKLKGQTGDEPELREALHAALAPDAAGKAWIALAGRILDPRRQQAEDFQYIQRVCEVGVHRAPKQVEPWQCVIEAAQRQRKDGLYRRLLEEYAPIAPKDDDVPQRLASVYMSQMSDELQAERIDAAHADLAKLEAFIGKAQLNVEKPIEPGMPIAWLLMAHGLYQQGLIAEAMDFVKKVEADKTIKPLVRAEAVELMAQIEMKRGDYAGAARDFAAAAAYPRDTPLSQIIDRANLRRLAGEAYLAGGDKAQADQLFQAALDEWEQVLKAQINDPQRATALTERARLYFDLGKHDEAVRGMLDAADVADKNAGILSDITAYLVTRGYLEQATDVYHKAIVADSPEYQKIYPSIWLISLDAIRGVPADRQAADFLAARKGTRWYHDLARFESGALTFDQLFAKANTRGKRAEAYFYEGLKKYAAKDRAGGDKDLRRVIQTEMFGFFEFDMAVYILANGPPQ